MKDFYGSFLNGGRVNDQKGLDFGNETDGYYYAGSSWATAVAMAAGRRRGPVVGEIPAIWQGLAGVHRAYSSMIDDQGETRFGQPPLRPTVPSRTTISTP